MATKPIQTDAEFQAEHARLMDELFPNRAESRARLPKGRTAEQLLAILDEIERVSGPLATVDEDFARDVEEGRRLLREGSRDWE